MKNFFLLTLLLATHLHAQPLNSYVPATKLLNAKGYQVGASFDSFTTKNILDEKGKKAELPEGYKFNRVESEFSGYYGATSDLQFGLGARFRQNRGVYEDSNGEEINTTASGLQSTFASIKFAFQPVNQIQYTLEGVFRYTPYTNTEHDYDTDDPESNVILGDAGNEISAGLGATYFSRNNNFLTVRGGYRRPGSQISQEIYWQLEGAMAWKYVALITGVDGVSSLKTDPYTDDPENKPLFNSSTNLYNTVNREWITPYAGVNFALGDTWRVEFRGSQTVSGRSTDTGTTFGVNLIRRVDKSATRLVDSKFKTYDLESSVTKVSPKKEYVEIDKGLADDFNKGMKIDFFEFDYVGGNILIASGIIVKTKSDSAIVKITQRYNMKKEIKKGLIGRATLK